jgi:hypothetical protein
MGLMLNCDSTPSDVTTGNVANALQISHGYPVFKLQASRCGNSNRISFCSRSDRHSEANHVFKVPEIWLLHGKILWAAMDGKSKLQKVMSRGSAQEPTLREIMAASPEVKAKDKLCRLETGIQYEPRPQ